MKNRIRSRVKALIPPAHRPRLRRLMTRVKYFGWRYQCPICHSHLRRLLPFGLRLRVLTDHQVVGGGYRPNAQCPVCNCVDRERLLYVYLSTQTNLFSERTKLLHVAPEGRLRGILETRANLDYVAADLTSPKAIVKMDITEIPYPANTFDVVICNHVLEHIIDDRRAMRELHRVLKPGAWGILQVPISSSLKTTYEDASVKSPAAREKAFGQSDHVRIYADDYSTRLQESGFEVQPFRWWKNDRHFGGRRNRFALLPGEKVFVVTKEADEKSQERRVG